MVTGAPSRCNGVSELPEVLTVKPALNGVVLA